MQQTSEVYCFDTKESWIGFSFHLMIGPYLVGQAILENPAGRLVGVISGRFYCYRDGRRARVRMELLRPAPPRTRVRSVLAYSVPAGVPAGVTDPCVNSGGK